MRAFFYGVMHFTLFLEICVLLCASVIMGFTVGRYLPAIPDKKVFWGCMLIGGLVAPASYLSNLTLASMPVMVNVLIALLFEGAVIIIGRTRFKERLQWRDYQTCKTRCVFPPSRQASYPLAVEHRSGR